MTDKELRKLKRIELIEILYYLKKENEELIEENNKLKERLYSLAEDAVKLRSQNIAEELSEPEKSEDQEAKENG